MFIIKRKFCFKRKKLSSHREWDLPEHVSKVQTSQLCTTLLELLWVVQCLSSECPYRQVWIGKIFADLAQAWINRLFVVITMTVLWKYWNNWFYVERQSTLYLKESINPLIKTIQNTALNEAEKQLLNIFTMKYLIAKMTSSLFAKSLPNLKYSMTSISNFETSFTCRKQSKGTWVLAWVIYLLRRWKQIIRWRN